MKKWILCLMALLVLSMLCGAAEKSSACALRELDGICPETRTVASNFSAYDLQGNRHQLVDYANKLIILNFWASWCLPCIRELPRLQRLHESTSRADLVVLTVNVRDRLSRVKRVLSKNNYDFITVLDSDGMIYKAFGVEMFPTTFLIAKDGTILGWIRGDVEWDSDRFILYLKSLRDR